ncbi:MAG: hypothetical protein AAGN82_25335 [Myxococcota bacterium]
MAMMRRVVGLGVVAMSLATVTAAGATEQKAETEDPVETTQTDKAKRSEKSKAAEGSKAAKQTEAAKLKKAAAKKPNKKVADESDLDAIDVSREDLDPSGGQRVAGADGSLDNTRKKKPGEADSVEEEEDKGLPARVPWRGSAVSWSNNASASLLGAGDDFQSDAFQTYVQTFSFNVNYFVIDQAKWSLAVQTTPSFATELTNSNITTRQQTPQFNDLPLNVVYRRLVHSVPDTAWATGLVLRARAFLPTSPVSFEQGTYLRTQPAAIMWQSIPLIPKDVAPVLNSVVIGGVANWTHRFGDSQTPVNRGLRGIVDRQGPQVNGPVNEADGRLDQNIQLTGGRFAQDTLGQAVFLFLSQPIGPTVFQFSTGFSFSQQFQVPFDNSTIECQALTGCLGGQEQDVSAIDGTDQQFFYGYFLSANFFPIPEAGVSFGYASVGNQLGLNGQRGNVFYESRYATFNFGLALSVDAIYEALTGPRRNRPFILVAENKKKPEERTREQPRRGIRNPFTF